MRIGLEVSGGGTGVVVAGVAERKVVNPLSRQGWDQWLRKWEEGNLGWGNGKSHVHWGFEMICREEGDFPPSAVGCWAAGKEKAGL